VADRGHLPQDLDLLSVAPDEVEDAVIGGLRVLQQRGERGDRLAGAGRGADDERPPVPGDGPDLG
jgi:hypothetical protein